MASLAHGVTRCFTRGAVQALVGLQAGLVMLFLALHRPDLLLLGNCPQWQVLLNDPGRQWGGKRIPRKFAKELSHLLLRACHQKVGQVPRDGRERRWEHVESQVVNLEDPPPPKSGWA